MTPMHHRSVTWGEMERQPLLLVEGVPVCVGATTGVAEVGLAVVGWAVVGLAVEVLPAWQNAL